MDDPKAIFKYKYERLQELLKGGPEVQLLDVAAILRHLLLDGEPLVDIVNREFRIPIRFKVFRSATEIYERDKLAGSTSTFVFVGNTRPPFAPLREIKKDKFLNFDLYYLDGTKFTVKQVIRLCANELGGVHNQKDFSKSEEQMLRTLNKAFSIGGVSSALAALQLIGSTTIEALEKLYSLVSKGQ
jgi:hypothetical protein